MSIFFDYVTLKEASELISIHLPEAISFCEKQSGKIYSLLAENLNIVNYGDSADKIRSAIKAKKETDARHRQDVEQQKLKAQQQLFGGKTYSNNPEDIYYMLKHVGIELRKLHQNNKISQDYANAINAIMLDLRSHIRSSGEPNISLAQEKATQRHQAATQNMAAKMQGGKHYSDLLEIVKTLREKGLPNSVSDLAAATAYEKIFHHLSQIHQSGGNIRQAVNHWLKKKEVGGDRASEDEWEVLWTVSRMDALLIPGKHKNKELPEEPENPEDQENFDLPPDNDQPPEDEDDTFQDYRDKSHLFIDDDEDEEKSVFDSNKVNNIPENLTAKEALKIGVGQSLTIPNNDNKLVLIKDTLEDFLTYMAATIDFKSPKDHVGMKKLKNWISSVFQELPQSEDYYINPNSIANLQKIRKILGNKAVDELEEVILKVLEKMFLNKTEALTKTKINPNMFNNLAGL